MFYVYADGNSIFNPLDETLTIHSPKITLEIGKAGSFQFNIPPTNEYYNRLTPLKTTIVVQYIDDRSSMELFRGRVLSTSKGFNKIKSVYCEGLLAYLVDSVQQVRSYKGTAGKLFRKIIKNHNSMFEAEPNKQFVVGNITIDEDTDVIIPGKDEDEDAYYTSKYAQAIIESMADEWITTYDYINDVLIDYLGGYLVARYENGVNYIDYVSDDDMYNGVASGIYTVDTVPPVTSTFREIEFGVNMLDLTEEIEAEDLCTILIPLGDSLDDSSSSGSSSSGSIGTATGSGTQPIIHTSTGSDASYKSDTVTTNRVLTIEKATNKQSDDSIEVVNIGGKSIGIAHKKAVQKYGRIIRTHQFEHVTNANTLFSDGKKYLKNHRNIPMRYTIKAVDLHFIDGSSNNSIRLGEMVSAHSSQHDLDINLLCTKIEYDLENPANNAYTLGNPEQTLTERYRKNKKKAEKQSKEHASKGGSAAGSAKQDAVGQAADTADDKIEAFRTEWIDVEPGSGHITLGTAYQKLVDGKAKLYTMAGIDLDSKDTGSSVDIFAMNQRIGENGEAISSNEARIKVVADNLQSLIELTARWNTETAESIASLTIRATDSENSIKGLTQFTTDISKSVASLEIISNDHESKIESLTAFDTETSNSLTKIEQKADANSGEIKLLTEFKTDTTESLGQITTTVNDHSSSISQLTTFRTSTESAMANIRQDVSKQGSSISALASYDTELTNSLAQIKATADDALAKIEMVATFGKNNASIKLTADAAGSLASIYATKTEVSNILKASTVFIENSLDVSKSTTIRGGLTLGACNLTMDYKGKINAPTTPMSIGDISVTNGNTIKIGGEEVATKKYVEDKIKSMVTGSFVAKALENHSLTVTGLTSSGTVKANTVTCTSGNMTVLYNNKQSNVATRVELNNHTHKFTTDKINIGHTHKVTKLNANTGGMSAHYEISLSGTTNKP